MAESREERRNQFTFYASFFESASRIKNKAHRADLYDALCRYALTGEEPDLDNLSDAAAVAFISARPNLDASRRKAKSGKDGGSKPKANAKQTESKAEKAESEKEKEVENEKENENEHECVCDAAGAFRIFFQAYPKKAGENNARAAWQSISSEDVPAVMAALEAFKASDGWKEQGGRFIPQAAKWLEQGQWRNPPSNGKRQFDKDEIAAVQRMLEEG